MIGEQFQDKGYGRSAMKAAIEMLSAYPSGQKTQVLSNFTKKSASSRPKSGSKTNG